MNGVIDRKKFLPKNQENGYNFRVNIDVAWHIEPIDLVQLIKRIRL